MSLIIERYTKVNGQKKDSDMAEESKYGQMAQNMKDTGRMIWQMAGEDSYIKMETSMKESGLTIKLMVEEPTSMLMELNILESGLMINRMDMELRRGLMVPATKAIMKMERSTVVVHSSGRIHPCSSESS